LAIDARQVWPWVMAGWSLLATGCHLVYHERSGVLSDARRTAITEPNLFNLHKNDYVSRVRNCLLARKVWADTLRATDGQCFSADFGRGFRDGFTDYLYAGGTGEPPPLPPRRYWKVGYQTSEGRQAIQDYFDGFRYGSAACRDGGYRQYTTVPSSLHCAAMDSIVEHGDFGEVVQPWTDPLTPTPETPTSPHLLFE
jgi:hypothetical protein